MAKKVECDEGTANWTKRLILNIKSWISGKHGKISYHLTQLLTRPQMLPELSSPLQVEQIADQTSVSTLAWKTQQSIHSLSVKDGKPKEKTQKEQCEK